MTNFIQKSAFFTTLLLLLGFVIPWSAMAQSPITISGDNTACVGDTKVYVPGISNSLLNYNWTVAPGSAGTVLTGNHTGANIQWLSVGTATINLVVTDAANNIVYNDMYNVTVGNMPAPYITTNVQLACQPLNQDSLEGESIPPPIFDSTHCQLVCQNSPVTYYANGNPGSTFTWVVTGAVSFSPSTGASCIVNWGSPGFGQVKLVETTASGCIAETYICVEVIEGPEAKFETVPSGIPDPIIICLNGSLVLQDLSTGSASSPIVSYLWDWGDGHQTPMSPGASGSTISHIYDNPGAYTVTLTVVNSCGCQSEYKRTINVVDGSPPKIACPRVVCEKEVATYSVHPDDACAPSSWEAIGGTILSATATEAQVIWDNVDPNTGFGYIMYQSCDPCPMIVTEAVPVVLNKANIQGPDVICEGKQYVYRLPKWPATEFDWMVSGPAIIQPTDQRNEIALTATGSGVITLSVKYHNTVLPCGGSASFKINVLPPETITGVESLCEGDNASYSLSGAYPGNWTLRTASGTVVTSSTGLSFNYTFTTPGNYRLSVTGTTFCPPEDFFIKVVAKPDMPDLITGPDRACPYIPIKYEAGNPIQGTTFKWFVTGGGTVSAPVGDYSFITFGTLPATIKAVRVTTDGLGCASDTLTFDVLPPIPPLSISGADTVCHSTIESYNVNYLEGDDYEWYLDNPLLGSVISGANTPNCQVQWNIPPSPGTTVNLIVKIKKCSGSVYKNIPVYIQGTPQITAINVTPGTTVCSDIPVTLAITTTIPLTSGNVIVNWGDGPPQTFPISPLIPIEHTYYTTGTTAPVVYTPVVTIEDGNGCLGSVTVNAPAITVMPKPVALLSPTGPIGHCGAFSETLNVTITTGIGGTNTYTWFPSISTSNTGTATAFGNYYVEVSNSVAGCSSFTNTVTIFDDCPSPGGTCPTAPVITLSNTVNNCGNIEITPNIPASNFISIDWSMVANPNVTINTINYTTGVVTATANAAGAYTFTYTVEYDPGCFKDYYITVIVPYMPDLRHEVSCNQAGGSYYVTLYDHSTVYPGTTVTRTYYKVPSTTPIGTGLNVTITQAPGTTESYYQVLTDGINPSCTSYITVTTPAFPAVTAFIDSTNEYFPGCEEDVTFQLGHTITGGNVTSWLWEFESGSTNASNANPIGKVYGTYGPKTATLKVTDIHGCHATGSVMVDVRENKLDGDMSALPNPVCQGDAVTLTYINMGALPTSFTWHEQTTPLITTPGSTYNVFQPGGYWVLAKDVYGCRFASNTESVDVIQVPPVTIIGNSGACLNQPFTLTAPNYGAGYTYSWSWTGATSGTAMGTSITHTPTIPGTYNYTVTITETASGMSCSQTSPPFTVTVTAPPPPPSLWFNITNCNPYELQLNASGVPGTYNWSNGMTGTTIYTPFGGDYLVTLTDNNGCVVHNSIAAPKSLEEYIWVFPTGCFCNIRTGYIIGPIIPLGWDILKDGIPDASGWGYMPPYSPLVAGHVYNMVLHNGWCDLMSGDLYFMSDTCESLPQAGSPVPKPGSFENESSIKDKNLLEISPNPADQYATVQFTVAAGSQNRNIKLVDKTGRILQEHILKEEKGSLRLDLKGYASGMYFVLLYRDGTVVQTLKLAVSK